MISKVSRFAFATNHTICIVAGGPHQDLNGARLMQSIKKKNPNTQFLGIGGPLMESEGLGKSYANIGKFWEKVKKKITHNKISQILFF
jgi:hypothetical protein